MVLLLIAGGLLWRASARTVWQWPARTQHGTTEALREPALLPGPDGTLVIWRDASMPAGLLAAVPGSTAGPHPIIAYPGVQPQRWTAAPAAGGSYHIAWREGDGSLHSALIAPDGATLRGPIDLGRGAHSDFAAVAHSANRLLILWIDASTAQLFGSDVDAAGRPRAFGQPILAGVSAVAASTDRAGRIHLGWLSEPEPGRRTVHYLATTPDQLTPDTLPPAAALLTFTLAPQDSLTAFALGLDETHAYIFWAIASADRPDVERVYVLAFLLDAPHSAVLSELVLPDTFTPAGDAVASALAIGPVASLPPDLAQRGPLRWPRTTAGQHDVLPLALALRTQAGWRPAVVYFRAGTALGFQIAAPLPADAAPPALTVTPSGAIVLAWAGLDGATPRLYTASNASQGLAPHTERSPGTLLENLLEALP